MRLSSVIRKGLRRLVTVFFFGQFGFCGVFYLFQALTNAIGYDNVDTGNANVT